jgi:hypothetical protein
MSDDAISENYIPIEYGLAIGEITHLFLSSLKYGQQNFFIKSLKYLYGKYKLP